MVMNLKNVNRRILALIVGGCILMSPMGLTACSDDDDEIIIEDEATPDEVKNNYTYDEIKGTKIDLNSPEFADLKKELEDYSKDRGVEITRISVKSSDLTPESNSILQKRREAEIKAKSIELEAKAKRRALDEEARGLESIVKVLKDQGLSSSDIAEYLRARALGSSDSKTVVVEKGENGRNLK